jgi:hypothetical protein
MLMQPVEEKKEVRVEKSKAAKVNVSISIR